jgi:NAD+-dependent secondary alcohol dehydrogenase Adh1
MKAQVLHKYDPEMKEKVWVTGEEMPNPKLEKSSDVIVKIGAAGVCRTDLHIIEGVWKTYSRSRWKIITMCYGT